MQIPWSPWSQSAGGFGGLTLKKKKTKKFWSDKVHRRMTEVIWQKLRLLNLENRERRDVHDSDL